MNKLRLSYSGKVVEALDNLRFLQGVQVCEQDTITILRMNEGDIIQVIIMVPTTKNIKYF